MSKRVKIFAIVVLVIAVIIFVSSLGGSKEPAGNPNSPLSSSVLPSGSGATPTTPTSAQLDNDFSTLLSSVKSISIDTSVFDNPSFKALRDHPVTLGTDTVGRSNPFAPIGTDTGPATAAFSIQTVQPGNITATSAQFLAQLTTNTTAPVTVVFQYGTSDVFGSTTTPVVLTKSGATVAIVKNLQPNTKYFVQSIAVAGSVTTPGNVMSFTTTAGATPH